MRAETPTEIGQKFFYGQDLRSLFPLGLYSESVPGHTPDGHAESAESRLRSVYRDWLQANDYADQICFLDITFGPETGEFKNSTLRTIILAPTLTTLEAYRKDVLDPFFLSGASLAAHPVFRAGLPIFKQRRKPDDRERRTLAEGLSTILDRMPEDSDELQECYSPENFELIDDGFLSEEFVPTCPPAAATAAVEAPTKSGSRQSDRPAFLTNIFGTFTGSELETGGAEVEQPLTQLWHEFTGLLRKNSSTLRSFRNETLGRVFALPIGLRDPANPRHLSWIADIYVGFDCETSEEQAKQFIRQLLLHLLRANSVLKTKRETLDYMLRSFGHEVKRVTRLISPAWVVPARNLLDVRKNSLSDVTSVPETAVGQLTLSDEFSSLADEHMLVAPFGRLLRAAQQTIDLWSWQNSYNNVPETLDQFDETSTILGWLPKTWEKVVIHAWKLARDQRIMNDIGGAFTLSAANLLTIQERLGTDLRSFESQEPVLKSRTTLPDLMRGDIFLWKRSEFIASKLRDWNNLQEQETRHIKASFAVLRVLVAWFSNCVQHGDRTTPIEVELRSKESVKTDRARAASTKEPAKAERTRYIMTITNRIAPSTAMLQSTQAGAKPSSSLYSVRLALEDLDGAILKSGKIEGNKYAFSCIFHWD